MKQSIKLISLAAVMIALSGCMDWWPEFGIPAGTQPWGEWNPMQGMHSQPSFKDQEHGAMRYIPPGTIPAEFRPYPFDASQQDAAAALKNPVAITPESLRYGKMAYETACFVCHGDQGKGDGPVAAAQTAINAADLTSAPIRNRTDGEIYHVISMGKGSMWAYKSQLRPLERWAVVNYIRALQRAEFPEPQDLETE